jgi:hypothetical protein
MNQQPKMNSFTTFSGTTLEDLKISIAASVSVPPRKKAELLSAVNSTALWLHRTPSEIPADCAYLDRAFERLNFGTLGVSRARFRNVRSLMKAAPKAAGVLASFQTKAELSREWAALRDRIGDKYAKGCLSAFVRFCSDLGIAPEHVNDEVMERFLEQLTEENVTPKPIVSVQSAVRL